MPEINYKAGQFARFFRPVAGRLVSRFGTARYWQTKKNGPIAFRNAATIGGRRPPLKKSDDRHKDIDPLTAMPCAPVELDTSVIVAITRAEAREFKLEYDKAVRQGDLEEVTEADYIAHLKADAERAKAARQRAAELSSKQAVAAAAEKKNEDERARKGGNDDD
jgi:hypothetical protein